jgi:hypothetical protein
VYARAPERFRYSDLKEAVTEASRYGMVSLSAVSETLRRDGAQVQAEAPRRSVFDTALRLHGTLKLDLTLEKSSRESSLRLGHSPSRHSPGAGRYTISRLKRFRAK